MLSAQAIKYRTSAEEGWKEVEKHGSAPSDLRGVLEDYLEILQGDSKEYQKEISETKDRIKWMDKND